MNGIEGWGLDVVLWFQSWRIALLEWLALGLHHAGSEFGYFFLLPTLYWSVDKELGKRVGILFL